MCAGKQQPRNSVAVIWKCDSKAEGYHGKYLNETQNFKSQSLEKLTVSLLG
jgi:hypothetical protein